MTAACRVVGGAMRLHELHGIMQMLCRGGIRDWYPIHRQLAQGNACGGAAAVSKQPYGNAAGPHVLLCGQKTPVLPSMHSFYFSSGNAM